MRAACTQKLSAKKIHRFKRIDKVKCSGNYHTQNITQVAYAGKSAIVLVYTSLLVSYYDYF